MISENLRKHGQGWICDLWLFVKFVEHMRHISETMGNISENMGNRVNETRID